MLVIILTVDRDKGRLLKNPDIISRGFIYLKDNQEILDEIRKRIRGLMTRIPNFKEVEPDYVKTFYAIRWASTCTRRPSAGR